MKKLLLFCLLVVLSASADSYKMGGVKVGVGSSSVGSQTSNSGVYVGMDGFVPLNNGFALGVGVDCVALDNTINNQASSNNYTLALEIKTAYSLEKLIKWHANLVAELGYGVTRIYTTNKYGSQYGIGTNIELYKRLSIGYDYKVIDTGFSMEDLHTHIVYLQMSWK